VSANKAISQHIGYVSSTSVISFYTVNIVTAVVDAQMI